MCHRLTPRLKLMQLKFGSAPQVHRSLLDARVGLEIPGSGLLGNFSFYQVLGLTMFYALFSRGWRFGAQPCCPNLKAWLRQSTACPDTVPMDRSMEVGLAVWWGFGQHWVSPWQFWVSSLRPGLSSLSLSPSRKCFSSHCCLGEGG